MHWRDGFCFCRVRLSAGARYSGRQSIFRTTQAVEGCTKGPMRFSCPPRGFKLLRGGAISSTIINIARKEGGFYRMERKSSLRSLLFLLFATLMVVTGPTSSWAATVKSEVHYKPGGFTIWYIVTSRKGFQPGDTWTLYTDAVRVRLPSGSSWFASHSGSTITFQCEAWASPPAEAVFIVDGRNIGHIGYSYDIESKSGDGTVDGPCRQECDTTPFNLPPSSIGP